MSQPTVDARLATIETHVAYIKEAIDKNLLLDQRVSKLEQFRAWASGSVTAAFALIGMYLKSIAK